MSPVCEIQDWVLTPEWTFEQVEDYLNKLALPREFRDPPGDRDADPLIALENSITISFGSGRLYGLRG
jgi:hypothetical protein